MRSCRLRPRVVTRALKLAIAQTLRVIERMSPLYGVIQSAAADPEVAELLLRVKAQRLATVRTLAEEFATKAGFAAELSTGRAADILYAVVSDGVQWRPRFVVLLIAHDAPTSYKHCQGDGPRVPWTWDHPDIVLLSWVWRRWRRVACSGVKG